MTDPAGLAANLFHDPDTWVVCGVSAGMGAIGGLAHMLVPDPDKPTWLRRVVLGAVAAVAVLWVTRPADGVALIASSLVAGYAGEAIMSALAAKSKLLAAQSQIADAKNEKNQAVKDVQRAIDALDSVTPPAPLPGGQAMSSTFGAPSPAVSETLRDLRKRYRGP